MSILVSTLIEETPMSVIEERGARYGKFDHNAQITQECEEIFRRVAPEYKYMPDVHKEALHMILQKLSRCACGDPFYLDNWIDIMGYAENVVNYIQEENY